MPHTGHKCRIPKLKLYRSQNHTSPCGQGHCFWKYSPWTIHPNNKIVFEIIFHLRKGMLWVRLALSPVCVDCLLSTLRPDVLACWERDSYILQMEQNNKIPSISISDRPIQFILPWRKFVSTRVSSSADVISTKYPPCSIQNLEKTNGNYITISKVSVTIWAFSQPKWSMEMR